jgi:predicted nucleic-acid-binding protein
VRITADTNVLVRAAVGDDKEQARAASKLLREAELVAVTTACLCEFVWVLRRLYGFAPADIGAALGALLHAENVVADWPAAEAGMAVLTAGGDFADGVIAYEGRWLGADTFVSFDRKAVALISGLGHAAAAPA